MTTILSVVAGLIRAVLAGRPEALLKLQVVINASGDPVSREVVGQAVRNLRDRILRAHERAGYWKVCALGHYRQGQKELGVHCCRLAFEQCQKRRLLQSKLKMMQKV